MSEAKVVCAVCERNVPDGDCMSRLRLTAADMQGKQFPRDRKPGLRGHCCQECRNVYLPVIAARLGKTAEEMSAHDTY
jgi:hypothetical protein